MVKGNAKNGGVFYRFLHTLNLPNCCSVQVAEKIATVLKNTSDNNIYKTTHFIHNSFPSACTPLTVRSKSSISIEVGGEEPLPMFSGF
jgi:hypothetical protein